MSYIPGTSPARSWRRLTSGDLLLLLGAVAFLVWFAWRATELSQYQWNWAGMSQYILMRNADGDWQSGALLRGLFATLRLGVWAMIVALISGGIIGALSVHQKGFRALPATLYINLFRNTPPLVLLFLVFFFAGSFFTEPLLRVSGMVENWPQGMQTMFAVLIAPPDQLDRMVAAVLTLGLYEGAYVAEIVRSGLESVPKNQWEASASQGLSRWQQYRYVITPQALRIMLPPLTGQSISTFKETTLASIISLPELTFQSLEIMAVTRMTFELWLTTAAIYLLISYTWSGLSHWLERRSRWRPL